MESATVVLIVIPANAGIQGHTVQRERSWTPAFARVTEKGGDTATPGGDGESGDTEAIPIGLCAMIPTLLSLLVLATLAAGAMIAVRRSRRWRVGRPAPVDLLAGIKALPGRYLVDVHDIV